MLKTLAYWRKGVRLYVALGIGLVTLEIWWWASVSYSGSILFATRMEEAYAWLAVGLLGLAIAIGPFYSVFPRLPAKQLMREARRLIGVGAAWFASLHVVITYVSLFKLANPISLPRTYQQSFVLGAVGLIILLAMAFTSFDCAQRGMGVWWYRLHRLVYVAVLVSLLHAFMIGTHATERVPLFILTAVAVSALALHGYIMFVRRKRLTIWQLLTISGITLLLIAIFSYGYGQKLGYQSIDGKQASQHE